MDHETRLGGVALMFLLVLNRSDRYGENPTTAKMFSRELDAAVWGRPCPRGTVAFYAQGGRRKFLSAFKKECPMRRRRAESVTTRAKKPDLMRTEPVVEKVGSHCAPLLRNRAPFCRYQTEIVRALIFR